MCLGVPARVLSIRDDRGTTMAEVDFGGATKDVCLAFVPDADVGTFVIVHAGFAIAVLDENAAAETLDLFGEIGSIEPRLDAGTAP